MQWLCSSADNFWSKSLSKTSYITLPSPLEFKFHKGSLSAESPVPKTVNGIVADLLMFVEWLCWWLDSNPSIYGSKG